MKRYRPVNWIILFFLLTSVGYAQPAPQRLLKHVVMMTFKEGAPASGIREVDESFKNLAQKLPMVKGYEWGPALPQEQAKTTTHVYVFSFATEKDLADYAQSPEHQRHIKVGADITERVQAVQYWVDK